MRIGIVGLAGRMGRLVADAVAQAGETLAGGVARSGILPRDGSAAGARLFDSAAALAEQCDAVVDFTHPAAVAEHARAVSLSGTAWVLGTTGLSAEDAAAVRHAAERVAVVQAANFSPGVNLVLALAERLARALPGDEYDAEILEMHHRHKVDAPSGTALALGQAVSAGRGAATFSTSQGAGPRATGAIGFASLRGGQVVGEHTVLFAGDGEHIALSHKALDRSVFARGAVRAALWAGAGRQSGLYSMMDVLGMKDGQYESTRPS